jgi:hypothetical protein
MGRNMTGAVDQPPPWINKVQAQALASYCDGEFKHMLDEHTVQAFEASVAECGDGLLKFLMQELSASEGADCMEEGLRRVAAAIDELRVVADRMAAKVFSEAAG